MPYLETTDEFWNDIADGTFAKVLHTDLCEQRDQPDDTPEPLKVCDCRKRFREALPERYARAFANDALFPSDTAAVPPDVLAEGVEELVEDQPKEETAAQRKAREKAEAKS